MAHQSYDAFVNNQQNPFVEQMRREGDEEQGGARNPVKGRDTQPLIAGIETKAEPIPEDSENDDEGAPNSGFVIHVATEPGKGKANLKFIDCIVFVEPMGPRWMDVPRSSFARSLTNAQ